jgi:hypothetical protein
VFSSGVSHRFYRHIALEAYRDTVQAKVNLVIET